MAESRVPLGSPPAPWANPLPPGLIEHFGWPGPWPITPVVVDSGVLLNSVFRGVRWREDQRRGR